MVAIYPELPDEESPEWFSIVPLISQVIFKQGGINTAVVPRKPDFKPVSMNLSSCKPPVDVQP
ncbi:MAG: hypothetical protein FJZ16_06625 [Candidatus Omnitrophica bacterium]|nr:hypothetical protein [Candidatus Omnitrophota bacterium]